MIAPSEPRRPHGWQAPRASQGRREYSADLDKLEERVLAGTRISAEEALFLHEHADLLTLGRMADSVRRRLHPDNRVTYIVDRNINPTNVCLTDCGF